MAKLRVFSPDRPGAAERDFPLHGTPVSIGRDPGCDLVLEGLGASRRHALLQPSAGGWTLQDLGSANGTLVEGQPIGLLGLQHGDTIRMGDSRLVFEDLAPALPAAVPVANPASAPCPACGAPVAPGVRFCGACGRPLGPAPPSPRAPRGKGCGCAWASGCGCLLLFLLLGGLAAFVLWRAGGLEGLTRRSIHTPRVQPS